jgi:hypothetical protein
LIESLTYQQVLAATISASYASDPGTIVSVLLIIVAILVDCVIYLNYSEMKRGAEHGSKRMENGTREEVSLQCRNDL